MSFLIFLLFQHHPAAIHYNAYPPPVYSTHCILGGRPCFRPATAQPIDAALTRFIGGRR